MKADLRSFRRMVSLAVVAAAALASGPSLIAQKDGIKVHGHWTIEVRNADGSLASRTEFDNALVPQGGDAFLVNLLTGHISTGGGWRLQVNGACSSLSSIQECVLLQAADPFSSEGLETSVFRTLNVARLPLPARIEISGRLTATSVSSSQINRVATIARFCGSDTAPDVCKNSAAGVSLFTSHTLATPVSFVAGQIIQVKVVISFS